MITSRYENTFCSNCGREFGPGDHGFSHCENHPGWKRDLMLRRQAGARKGWETRKRMVTARSTTQPIATE